MLTACVSAANRQLRRVFAHRASGVCLQMEAALSRLGALVLPQERDVDVLGEH